MNNLTDFTDTTDVSDAAIEWVCENLGYPSEVWTPISIRQDASDGSRTDQVIAFAARLIQRHHPELLADPVDAIVREELAKVYDEKGLRGYADNARKGEFDGDADFTAAKRLYLLGIEKGKQS